LGPVSANAGNTDEIRDCLTQIVSQLTGYPVEMLGLDMDIEADLGIDSIKRVEILSALEERLPHLPKVTPDMVGTLKSLGQICEFLSKDASDNDACAVPPSVARRHPESASMSPAAAAVWPAAAATVDAQPMAACSEIKVVELPQQPAAKLEIAADHIIAVVSERDDPLAGALAQAFASEGFKAVLLKDRTEFSRNPI
jgi:acyl carrier protein